MTPSELENIKLNWKKSYLDFLHGPFSRYIEERFRWSRRVRYFCPSEPRIPWQADEFELQKLTTVGVLLLRVKRLLQYTLQLNDSFETIQCGSTWICRLTRAQFPIKSASIVLLYPTISLRLYFSNYNQSLSCCCNGVSYRGQVNKDREWILISISYNFCG